MRTILNTNKVAIVIAGGSGMGAAAARQLAADGFHIAILSSSGAGEALANELGGVGVTGSNQSEAEMQALVEKTLSRWGRIDALVNSAGHGPRGPILEMSDQEWHRGLDVYLLNVVRAARLVTPIFRSQKAGSIINISSFAAFEPDPAFPTSGIFRAGLASFARLFATEYAPENVRMNNVLPGFIDSFPEKSEVLVEFRWDATAVLRRSHTSSPTSPPIKLATSLAKTSRLMAALPATSSWPVD